MDLESTSIGGVRRNLRLFAFGLAVLVFMLGVLAQPSTARAASLQIRIYSSLEPSSGLFEYGRHFNEGNVAFGARDFNYPNDGGAPVYLRLNLARTQTYYVRYHVWPSATDQCVSIARMAQYIGDQWIEIGGTELHFVHMGTRVADTWTNYIINANESIGQYVGTLGACGVTADKQHSHMSADVGTTSLMTFASQGADTCWTNYEYSFQCPSTYPDWTSCTTSGPLATISGVIPEYVCAEWSKRDRSPTTVMWFVSY